MDYDLDKIDDAVLAVLCLTLGANGSEYSAWKGHSWTALERLYDKGYLCDPRNRNKSVVLTPEGLGRAQRLFDEMFGTKDR